MLSLKKLLIPAAIAGSALLIAACGGSSSNSSPAASKPASPYSGSSSASSAPATSSSVKLTTVKGPMGTYLVGSSNRALYLWAADGGGRSSCAGQCAKFWPPLLASSMPQTAGGVNGADISLITRADGQKQVAYKGHPLYYFAEDSKADPTKGQGNDNFGAKWWLVTPSGAAITKTVSASGGSATASASGSSSGSASASSNGSSSSSSSGSSGGGGWG